MIAGSNVAHRKTVASTEDVNSAAIVYFQVGPTSDYDTLSQLPQLQVFSEIASERFFSQVGTQEKLGYIVW